MQEASDQQQIGSSPHRRKGQGEGGWAAVPQFQKLLKFSGQNADDSGKSTREKTL